MYTIHAGALLFCFGVSPLVFLLSVLFKRKYQNVILEWKKTQQVITTIIAFVLNLTFFVLTSFFFASYLGRIEGIQLIDLPAQTMYYLGIDSFMLLVGITIFYFALQNFYSQFVTLDGVYYAPSPLLFWKNDNKLLRWEEIKDYYVKSDYPITIYHFIVQKEPLVYDRIQIKVPFYTQEKFEEILDMNLKKIEDQKSRAKDKHRKMTQTDEF